MGIAETERMLGAADWAQTMGGIVIEEHQSSEILKCLKLIFREGDTIELRCFKGDDIFYGRYGFTTKLLEAVKDADADGFDCYYCSNPTSKDKVNWARARSGSCSSKKDIPRYRWFLVDVDPIRTSDAKKHMLATESQVNEARKVAYAIQKYLKSMGWEYQLFFSGNGYHLLISVDWENTPAVQQRIKNFQKVLMKQFCNEHVKIDSVPDPNRMIRSYGTLNTKGTETTTLKYRRSGLVPKCQ